RRRRRRAASRRRAERIRTEGERSSSGRRRGRAGSSEGRPRGPSFRSRRELEAPLFRRAPRPAEGAPPRGGASQPAARPHRVAHRRARARARGAGLAARRSGGAARRRARARARGRARGAARRDRRPVRRVGELGRGARGRGAGRGSRLSMRVALIHDWLTGLRGGERVLDELLAVWPDAGVHTLVHVPGTTTARIDARVRATSPLQRVPGAGRHWRKLLLLHPWAARRLRVEGYDLAISVHHAVAKAARIDPRTPHLCYCLTPMRYVWDQADAYRGRRVRP